MTRPHARFLLTLGLVFLLHPTFSQTKRVAVVSFQADKLIESGDLVQDARL